MESCEAWLSKVLLLGGCPQAFHATNSLLCHLRSEGVGCKAGRKADRPISQATGLKTCRGEDAGRAQTPLPAPLLLNSWE